MTLHSLKPFETFYNGAGQGNFFDVSLNTYKTMSKKKLTLTHLTKEVQDFDEREGINNGYDVAMYYAINGNTNMYKWLSEYNNETLMYLNSMFINNVSYQMTYAENRLMQAILNVLRDRLHIK